MTRLSMLSSAGADLIVHFRAVVRDKAAGALRKRWKYWDRRVALELQATCWKMESPLVRCREEDEYEKKFSPVLGEVHRHFKVVHDESIYLLTLPENPARL